MIIIYTDGACKGNPGLGAFAATIEHDAHKQEISGIVENTTNNQMELLATIKALEYLQNHVQNAYNVTIYTDSQYVQKGITLWIHGWKKRQWKDVKNLNLWHTLDKLNAAYNINWQWVRGHDNNQGNEYVDQLANIAIKEYLQNKLINKMDRY